MSEKGELGTAANPLKLMKVYRPRITVERGDGILDGRREIWARQEEAPELDALLVTVHYSYAYLDNSTIDGVAERITRILAGLPQ